MEKLPKGAVVTLTPLSTVVLNDPTPEEIAAVRKRAIDELAESPQGKAHPEVIERLRETESKRDA